MTDNFEETERLFIDRLGPWALAHNMPDRLMSEIDSYMNDVDREYEIPLGLALFDYLDRHDDDPKAGWLDRESLRFIRQGMIETGIVQDLDRPAAAESRALGGSPASLAHWFTQHGIRYEFDPTSERK